MAEQDSDVWRRARDLFDRAVELPDEERSGYLSRACVGEPDVRRAVERLLDADADVGSGLGDSAVVDALEDALDKNLGRSLGSYHLLCKLGGGGMGSVYLAEHTGEGRRVAIKLLRHGLASGETLRRFRLESRVLASLEHPNVTRLLDDGVTDSGRPYLVMEWVDGQPITDYCDTEKMSVEERLVLVAQVADALHHAHGQLVVHRDIKPSNVLVTSEGIPKVLDFGIAKVLEGSPFGEGAATRTLSRPLTPGYASPEQTAGTTVGTASDVYSLAVLAYELVVGRTPFDWAGRSLPEIQHLYSTEPAPPLRSALDSMDDAALGTLAAQRRTTPDQLRRHVCGDVSRVLGKALEREADARYPSARHFGDDLRRVVEGQPVRARPATPLYHLRKFAERNRLAVAFAALAAVAIVILAVLLVVESRRAVEERDLARLEQSRAEAKRLRATAANEFLVDLFRDSGPRDSAGRSLTSREMLEVGTRKLRQEPPTDPAELATLLTTIAQAYQNLGDFDAAAEHFEQALSVRREAWEKGLAEAGEVASSLDAMGKVLRLQGHFEDAEQKSREALRMRQELFGPEHEAVAQSLDNLAEALHELGRYDEAEPLYVEAIAIRQQALEPSDPRLMESLEHYALLKRNLGRHAEARELYEKVLVSRMTRLQPGHPDLARSHYQLGLVEQDLDRPEAAEEHLETALELYRKAYGDGLHPAIASCLHDLGVLAFTSGRIDTAADQLSESLAMRYRIYTANHPELVQTLGWLARVAVRRGQLDKAGELLGEALERSRELFGEEHPYTATTLRYRAELEAGRGDVEAAAATMRTALDVLTRTLGKDHHKVFEAEKQMGRYLEELGRLR